MYHLAKKMLLSLIIATSFTHAFAQEPDGIVSSCNAIIDRGLREYDIDKRSVVYLNSIHDRYCDAQNSVKSRGAGISLDAVVETIPLGLAGDYSSNEEAMRNFCRNYESDTFIQSGSLRMQERIIERAYDSFDSCISIAAEGIRVTHSIRNIEAMDFYIASIRARPVTLNGMGISDNVTCSSVFKGEQLSSEELKNEQHIIAVTETMSINCERTPSLTEAGDELFEEATITLFTDVGSNGNYGVYWPQDSKLAPNKASEIQQVLEDLVNLSNEQQSELDGIGASLDYGRIHFGDELPEGAQWTRKQNGIDFLSCASGSYIAGVGVESTPNMVERVSLRCLPIKQ